MFVLDEEIVHENIVKLDLTSLVYLMSWKYVPKILPLMEELPL